MHTGREEEQPSKGALFDGIQTVRRTLDKILLGTGYLAGGLFVILAFFVTYDVIARKWGGVFGLPTTRVTDEISGYMLVLAATWGFAYTLRTDAHVRIDVLLPYMPRRLRAVMDFVALILTGFLSSIFAWKIWVLTIDSLETGIKSSTYLLTPLWVPQGILLVGFVLLALTAVILALVEVVEAVAVRQYGVGLAGSATHPMAGGLAEPPAPGTGGGTAPGSV